MTSKHRVGTDDKPIDPTLHKSGEGCIEVGIGTRVHDEKVLFDRAGSSPHVVQLDLGIRILWIDQHADQFGFWHDREAIRYTWNLETPASITVAVPIRPVS